MKQWQGYYDGHYEDSGKSLEEIDVLIKQAVERDKNLTSWEEAEQIGQENYLKNKK